MFSLLLFATGQAIKTSYPKISRQRYCVLLAVFVSGNSQPDFDNQTLAILRGRLVRYLMRSKEVSI